MKHSDKFNMIKTFYMRKMWNDKKVRDAVEKGWITPDEYKEITGNDYEGIVGDPE